MYVQRFDDQFVLNPRHETENSSYEFEDGRLRLYIENKKYLRRELTQYFGKSSTADFLRKVGSYNVYDVTIHEPILEHGEDCYVTDTPSYTDMLMFRITIDPVELTNSKKRSTLLKYFVLGQEQSANFMKDVEERCLRSENNGLVTLTKKSDSGKTTDETEQKQIETP